MRSNRFRVEVRATWPSPAPSMSLMGARPYRQKNIALHVAECGAKGGPRDENTRREAVNDPRIQESSVARCDCAAGQEFWTEQDGDADGLPYVGRRNGDHSEHGSRHIHGEKESRLDLQHRDYRGRRQQGNGRRYHAGHVLAADLIPVNSKGASSPALLRPGFTLPQLEPVHDQSETEARRSLARHRSRHYVSASETTWERKWRPTPAAMPGLLPPRPPRLGPSPPRSRSHRSPPWPWR